MFSLHCFDSDSGELVKVIRDVSNLLAKPMAMDLMANEHYHVKVVDQKNNAVTWSIEYVG